MQSVYIIKVIDKHNRYQNADVLKKDLEYPLVNRCLIITEVKQIEVQQLELQNETM